MKLVHPAALALVYLMLPTPYGEHSLRYVPELPLSKWSVFQSFDSADSCESIFATMRTETNKNLRKGMDPDKASPDERMAFLFTQAECISSDDPRLKEK